MSKLDTFFKRKYSFLNDLMSFYPFFKKNIDFIGENRYNRNITICYER